MYDKHTKDSITNYNKIAHNYDDSLDGQFTKDLKVKLVEKIELKPKSRILDVACANGSLLEMINYKNVIDGYGIDISDKMIKQAKLLHPQFKFSVSNSNKLVFEDSFFDAITVCAAFHHFSEPLSFLTEAKRVLKPNGLLFIMEPYFNPFIRIIFNLLIPFLKMGDVKVYKKDEIQKMISNNGLINIHYSKETNHGCLFIGKLT
jgi:Methylase involved in ubiquinone/menaquinone biosynthesis